MKKFIFKHWQTIVFSIFAIMIFYRIYTGETNADYRFVSSAISNSFFEQLGKWGIRFLLISLVCSPIYAFTGRRFPLKLRKVTGLWAFAFISVHVWIAVTRSKSLSFTAFFHAPYVVPATIAFAILVALAITSFKPVMRLVGHWWKPLHRLVYVAAILSIVHSLMVATSGKRAFMGGQQSAEELRIYLYMLIGLLLVRIPIVKHTLQRIIPFAPNPRKSKQKNWFGKQKLATE